jgi:hypothetical protein
VLPKPVGMGLVLSHVLKVKQLGASWQSSSGAVAESRAPYFPLCCLLLHHHVHPRVLKSPWGGERCYLTPAPCFRGGEETGDAKQRLADADALLRKVILATIGLSAMAAQSVPLVMKSQTPNLEQNQQMTPVDGVAPAAEARQKSHYASAPDFARPGLHLGDPDSVATSWIWYARPEAAGQTVSMTRDETSAPPPQSPFSRLFP